MTKSRNIAPHRFFYHFSLLFSPSVAISDSGFYFIIAGYWRVFEREFVLLVLWRTLDIGDLDLCLLVVGDGLVDFYDFFRVEGLLDLTFVLVGGLEIGGELGGVILVEIGLENVTIFGGDFDEFGNSSVKPRIPSLTGVLKADLVFDLDEFLYMFILAEDGFQSRFVYVTVPMPSSSS